MSIGLSKSYIKIYKTLIATYIGVPCAYENQHLGVPKKWAPGIPVEILVYDKERFLLLVQKLVDI